LKADMSIQVLADLVTRAGGEIVSTEVAANGSR
jgi:hypothetical protein